MLNPAWQPAHRDKPALRQLRRHYLPDLVACNTDTSSDILQVPVITTATPDPGEMEYLLQALTRQLNLPQGEAPDTARWRVQALEPTHLSGGRQLPFILAIVQADLRSLRQAYGLIKHVHRLRSAPFGVLIQGARDLYAARRYYRRLAMATTRFLDLTPLNLGVAPLRSAAFGGSLAALAQAVRDGAADQPANPCANDPQP